MRIRSVKPEYWQHRMHKRLCVSASLLGAALLDYADDEGRFEAEGTRIHGMLVPAIALEKSVVALLVDLEAFGWLILYSVELDGVLVPVGQICAFERHQVIQRPRKSLLPPPPAPWIKVDGKWVIKGGVNDESLTRINTADGPVNEASGHGENSAGVGVNDESLGSGVKEGKGMEGTKGVTRARPGGEGLTEGEVGLLRELGSELGKKNGAGEKPGGPPPQPSPRGEWEAGDREAGDREAVIPTEGEVLKVCEVDGVEAAYGSRFWRSMTNDHGWVKNGRLRRWRNILADRWGQDRAGWLAGRMAGSPFKNGAGGEEGARGGAGSLPAWRRIEGLKRAILEHPANAKGAMYEPRCSRHQKLGLAALEEELAGLERGDFKGKEKLHVEQAAAAAV